MAGNNTLFMSPQNAQLDNLEGDFTPELDYLDGDASFDFDNADLGGEMIGALPGGEGSEQHEKRKSPDEKDADDNDPKRPETLEGEKGAKKPGRKPLTSEPTTKRKAQNRAAQRAFRERKEKHLKDLETRVTELTKAQEADKHENGLLKAQVERLQIELREYRKRLSLNSGSPGARSSSSLTAYTGQNNQRGNSGNYGSNQFQFDFPQFGALPGSQIFGKGNTTPPAATRSPVTIGGLSKSPPAQVQRQESQNSTGGRTLSPKTATPTGDGSNANASPQQCNSNSLSFPSVGYSTSGNMHGFGSTFPQMTASNPFGDLFSPGLLKSANLENGNSSYFGPNTAAPASNNLSQTNLDQVDSTNGGETGAGLKRVFQFNGGNSSASDSTSPSASSSNWNANGPNSSCGTSPDPSHDSPANQAHNGSIDSYTNGKSNPLRQYSNASDLYGSDNQQQNGNTGIDAAFGHPDVSFRGDLLDTLGNFNGPTTGSFDPVLFGDYRDPNAIDNLGGSNDFSNAFFDDALNNAPFDYGSPSNLFGILQSPQLTHSSLNVGGQQGAANAPTPSSGLMKEIEKVRDGGDDDCCLPVQQATLKQTQGQKGKLVSCNNIWNQLQSNPDFQSGTFDLDSLCSELRSKARCSDSGVMVSQDHVDAALKKLGKKDDRGRFMQPKNGEMPGLMFEQESWDEVLRKLGNNSGRQ